MILRALCIVGVVALPALSVVAFARVFRRVYETGLLRGASIGFEHGWEAQGRRCSLAMAMLHERELGLESLSDMLVEIDALALTKESSAEDLEEWYAKQAK